MKRWVLPFALIVLASSAIAQTPSTHNQAAPAGAAGVAAHMQALGYSEIHDLRRGPDGKWVGQAIRNGVPVTVTAEPQGNVIAR